MSEAVNNRAGERKAARFEAKAVKPDGSFEGYASLFGAEDLGRDVVMPGAFRKSLAKRGPRGVKLLYQHDPNEVIGTWEEIREDERGLFVRGQLLADVARAREVLSLETERRNLLEHRVVLLRPGSIDPDLLEERARLLLNFGRPDDVIILDRRPDDGHKPPVRVTAP